MSRKKITRDDLLLTPERAREVAYSSTSGDLLAERLGIHHGAVDDPDAMGITKREVFDAALDRDVGFFKGLLNRTEKMKVRPPSQRRLIPKKGSVNGKRPIDVPAEVVRLMSLHVRSVIQPLLLVLLLVGQFGLRRSRPDLRFCKRRGATEVDHFACWIHQLLNEGYRYVLLLDLEDAFGKLPHRQLRHVLRRYMTNEAAEYIINLVAINTWDRRAGKTVRGRGRGAEQGNPLSALLFSVALAPVLREVEKIGDVRVLAYLDDVYVIARDEVTAKRAYKCFRDVGKGYGFRGIRPLQEIGGDPKASRIIDTSLDPVRVLDTYLVTPSEIGLTPEKVGEVKKILQNNCESKISIRRLRELAHARALTKRWGQRVGLVRRRDVQETPTPPHDNVVRSVGDPPSSEGAGDRRVNPSTPRPIQTRRRGKGETPLHYLSQMEGQESTYPKVGNVDSGDQVRRESGSAMAPPALGAVPPTPGRVTPAEDGGEDTFPPPFSSPLADDYRVRATLGGAALSCGTDYKDVTLDLRGVGSFVPADKEAAGLAIRRILRAGRRDRKVYVLVAPWEEWTTWSSVLGNSGDDQYRWVQRRETKEGLFLELKVRRRRVRRKRPRVTHLPVGVDLVVDHIKVPAGPWYFMKACDRDGPRNIPGEGRSPNRPIRRLEALAAIVRENPGLRVRVRFFRGLEHLLNKKWHPTNVALFDAVRTLRSAGRWYRAGTWVELVPDSLELRVEEVS